MKHAILCICVCLSIPGLTEAQIETSLPEMLKGRWKIYDVADTINPVDGSFDAIMVSKGLAVYSTYLTENYEANALWCYDKIEKILYSIESKSNGLVWIHIGEVIDDQTLILRRYSKEKPNQLLQETTIQWISSNKILNSMRLLNSKGEWNERQFYFIK
jgi:hypothetical protein